MPLPLKPVRLQTGQTIGICCPASPPPKAENIDRAVSALEALGYKTKLSRHARARNGFLAGTDRERASDLMALFKDRQVDAIFCFRGGYGCTRILPLLDFATIRTNSKVLLGYSDVTALHCALLKHANLISFHGPVLNSDFLREPINEFTMHSLWRTIGVAEPAGPISFGEPGPSVAKGKKTAAARTVIRPGRASGRLVGGNLSLLSALVGTPWLPSLRNRILFFEDVDEAPYRIDRLLTHLLGAGWLQQAAAIAIGTNSNCEDPRRAEFNEFRQTADDVLRERLAPLGIPVVAGLPFGHQPINATLPVGVRAELNAGKGELTILDPAVR